MPANFLHVANITSTAKRMRAHRIRLECGRQLLRIDAKIGSLGDVLKANGFLDGDWIWKRDARLDDFDEETMRQMFLSAPSGARH